MYKFSVFALAVLSLCSCTQTVKMPTNDLSLYTYCASDHKRLAAAYRTNLALGKYSEQVQYVQPANINDKCLVKLWTSGPSGQVTLNWHGQCSKEGYAEGLGLVITLDEERTHESVRLYEGDGQGSMVSYYGFSDKSGKIWSGKDDSVTQTFFVTDLEGTDKGFAVVRTDYAKAESHDFIFTDNSLAMIRMYPNFSEEFSRSYSDGDYTSDLFYSLFEIPSELDGKSRMTGVSFSYSGRDRSMTVMDAVGGKEPVVSTDPVSPRYINEIMDTQQQLLDTMNEINAQLPELMHTARLKMQKYQRQLCRGNNYQKMHVLKDDLAEICSLKVLAPAKNL